MANAPHQVLLIVEDEERLTQLLKSAFVKEGFAVTHANSGEEGLSEALSSHPSAILLDIMLPGMDGLTVLSKLRQDEWGKHVPVVMLTNLSPDNHIIEKVEHDEPSYYIIKVDSTTEDIIAKVKAAIGSVKE